MFDEKYPEVDPNKKSAAEIWNARYAGETYLFGKEPAVVLKSFFGELRSGRTLDVAMGEGRNAVFLASKGFTVEGVDGSSVAIEKAKKLAAEKNVSIDAKTQSLDFFLMPLMKFDTIVMTYYRPHARFFSEIRRGLVEGGTFALEAHVVGQRDVDFDQCFKPNEVIQNLKDLRILYYREIPDGTSHTVQCIAKKVSV